MSELQHFEKIPELRDSILFAAHNWKINTGWTNHLEIINSLCKEREQMLDMLETLTNMIAHLDRSKLPISVNMRIDKYVDNAKQLIQQATTIKNR